MWRDAPKANRPRRLEICAILFFSAEEHRRKGKLMNTFWPRRKKQRSQVVQWLLGARVVAALQDAPSENIAPAVLK